MRWIVEHGDILDVSVDVLVCSANPFLTLSGGVGGALRERYGDVMQDELNAHLTAHGKRYVDQGSVVACSPCGTPYKAVLHAAAVDGMYDSSLDVISDVVRESLDQAAGVGAASVALPALATGYGHLSVKQFATGLLPLIGEAFDPVERVHIVARHEYDAQAIEQVIRAWNTAPGSAGRS